MPDDPPTAEHTANLLGALALALADRMTDAVCAPDGIAASDATALSALHHFLGEPSIDRIRQVLGLTHSGAVRLVDRLVAGGFVRREPGPDGRTSAVTLTPDGRRTAATVSAARAETLAAAIAPLGAADRHTLDRLAGQLLTGLMRGPGATRWICRLCDTGACGRDRGRCPLEREAARRHT